MKEPTVRIGDKNKSVRVKKYLFDFYCVMTEKSEQEAKEVMTNQLKESVERIGSKSVTGDLLVQHMLVDIESIYKPKKYKL